MAFIPIEAHDLMRQASMTSHQYLYEAIESIDKLLGKGYSVKNPKLVATIAQIAADDFNNAMRMKLVDQKLTTFSDLFCELLALIKEKNDLE